MSYTPLVEHSRPRVMMLDFPSQDVAKFTQMGFEARRGATGLFDRDKFSFPYAVQDVEVLFAQVNHRSFAFEGRTADPASIQEQPFFQDLVREIWAKGGWSILFVAQNTQPRDIEAVGIGRLGVIPQQRDHIPESARLGLIKAMDRSGYSDTLEMDTVLPAATFPKFVGQAVNIAESNVKPIIQRYIQSARMSILTCQAIPSFVHQYLPSPLQMQPHVLVDGSIQTIEALIYETSADKNILGIGISQTVYAGYIDHQSIRNKGGILILPDFGHNNGNVALALLQEFVTITSPHLFDNPQHPWLESYQAVPVQNLLAERERVIEEAQQKLDSLDTQIEETRQAYEWLTALLTSIGDDFTTSAARALEFLGFEVEEVDNTIQPGERKREDLRVHERSVNYFALGEAKTTGKGRGASDEFITKTQTHQNRYGREHNQPSPSALLIVNFAIDLEPSKRLGRFYQQDMVERLEDNQITAISSYALFQLCQLVMTSEITKEQSRALIRSRKPIIAQITSDMF